MNPVMLFSLIATNPLSKRAIKKLLEKDGETTRLDKLLRAYAYGENGGFGEMSLLLTVKKFDHGSKAMKKPNFEAYLKMLRIRSWLGYFLIAALGYTISTKLNAHISETIFFFVLVCLYLGFSFSINNYFDVKEDLLKRKKSNPVAMGEIKQKEGIIFSLLLALLSISLSLLRGLNVFYFFFILIFLSLSYSSPPFRLKSRPFLDLISHGLFFGSLLFLFPSVFFFKDVGLLHALIAISIFYFSIILELRNHIEDYESDKKAGLRTTVCVLGLNASKKITYFLSLLFPLLLLPIFYTINKHITFSLFLAITAIFYLAFYNKKSYRILDIYSSISYFLIILGVLL